MKLLTEEIKKRLPELYETEGFEDPLVVCKFFTPDSNWTWYVVEGSREGDTWRFFGLVKGHEEELGYFVLAELESAKGPLGLGIERDIHWTPEPISEVWQGWPRINSDPEHQFYVDIGLTEEQIEEEDFPPIYKYNHADLDTFALVAMWFSAEGVIATRDVIVSVSKLISFEYIYQAVKRHGAIYHDRVGDQDWFVYQ